MRLVRAYVAAMAQLLQRYVEKRESIGGAM